MLKNITEQEIPRLPADLNLTDGHAYRSWSSAEEKVIERTADIFKSVNRQMQFDLEQEYVSRFLTLGKQTVDFESHKYLMCTTASMGMEIIANYLRLNDLKLSLIEPCFDNLADICKRHNVLLVPFPDEIIDGRYFVNFLDTLDADAICLVTPNNPTGTTLTEGNFLKLVDFCRQTNKLLILDCAFRAYTAREQIHDQYGILGTSGLDYILIEDTGKTWPTAELKAPFLTVSSSIYQEIYDIYTDMVLHVSPFAVKLMTEMIEISVRDELAYIHHIVKTNRECLNLNIQGTLLTPVEKPPISISWLQVDGMTGFELKQILDNRQIHIVPGDYFFWSDPKKGTHFVRVALTRDPNVFSRAATLLGEVCRELTKR